MQILLIESFMKRNEKMGLCPTYISLNFETHLDKSE